MENITRTAGPQVSENASSGNQSEHIVKYTANRVLIDPGTYDIFTVANGDVTGSFNTENEFINLVDRSTYKDGFGVLTEDGTLLMSGRADNSGLYEGTTDSNLKVTVREILPSEDPTIITINLERAMAKVLVGQSKEKYDLTTGDGDKYVSISLSGFQYINLSRWFYTFRHTAVLTANRAPSSYTITNENFGEINPVNGYVIDPYFFSKTIDGATDFDNTDGYYAYPLKTVAENWQSVPVNSFHGFYCLENCMFRPAQNTVYTTGIMLKGTFTPEASQTIGNNGNPVEDPLVFNTLYYFNYKFYTTLAAVGKYGDANIDGLTEESSDAELAAKQITRFTKNGGNFSTFYNYWIKHLDNNNPTVMGVMEFGIVRNNIYSVNITSIKNLGPGTPDTKLDPDENKAFLDVEFGVYPWIVRDQDADLE